MMTKKEYLLLCLMEECNEVAQAASKCLRFGFDDKHPEKEETNLEGLKGEMNDLRAIVGMLLEEGVDINYSARLISKKYSKTEHYMGYSQKAGILNVS